MACLCKAILKIQNHFYLFPVVWTLFTLNLSIIWELKTTVIIIIVSAHDFIANTA